MKNDLRVIKTKRVLYQTLEELMKNQSFESIKVSDICQRSLINRSTFYSHYQDKYELLSEYINSLKDTLEDDLSKNTNINNTKSYYMEMLRLLLDHIELKKDAYTSAMINNQNGIVIDILYDVIDRSITQQIDKTIENNSIPASIVSKFYTGAVVNVGIEWMRSNKYTKNEILEYFDKLIPNDIK